MKNILASGIDVSIWQRDFDMAAARDEGFSFVVIKGAGTLATGYRYKDPWFDANYEKAKRLDMNVGAFFYSMATTEDEAIAEANFFYENVLKGRQFDLPVYMDVEEARQKALGRRRLTDVIHAFCQALEGLGYWAGIYASLGVFKYNVFDDELQRYAHWIACWATDCIYDGECFGMWQYGGETNYIRSNQVAGKTVDQDYLLEDYPSKIKAVGLNGYPKPHVHTIVTDAKVDPTCAAPGRTQGERCSTCGEVFVEPEIIPATGHKWNGKKCSVCGVNNPNFVAKHGDVNEDGEVDTKDLVAEMKALANGYTDSRYDINKDGVVDTKDLVAEMKKIARDSANKEELMAEMKKVADGSADLKDLIAKIKKMSDK